MKTLSEDDVWRKGYSVDDIEFKIKKSWTEIVSKNNHEFEANFLREHINCCEMIVDKEGKPLAAVYFTPFGKEKERFKAIMKEIRDRIVILS